MDDCAKLKELIDSLEDHLPPHLIEEVRERIFNILHHPKNYQM